MKIPTWPESERVLPNVGPAPALHSLAVPDNPIGPALTQAAGQVGALLASRRDALERIKEERKQQNDASVALAGENELADYLSTTLRDPESGFLTQQGDAAVKASPKVLTDARARRDEIARRLANDDQRELFYRRSSPRLETFKENVMDHSRHAWEQFQAATDAANHANTIRDVNAAYNLPKEHDQLMTSAMFANAAEAKRRGLSGPAALAFIEGRLNEYHAAVLDGYLEDYNPYGAEIYLEARESEMDPQTVKKYRSAIKPAMLDEDALKAETDIAIAHPGDYAAQLTAARAIRNPELQDKVLHRLDVRQRADEHAAEVAYEQVVGQAEDAFRRAGWRTDGIPMPLRAKLRPKEEQAFRRLEKERYAPEKVTMDDDAAAEWYGWMIAPRDVRARTNLFLQFKGRIPDAMLQSMVKDQQSVRDELGKPQDPKTTEVESVHGQLTTAARQAGVLPWSGEVAPEKAKKFAALTERFRVELQTLEADVKRKATFDERQQIIDRLTKPIKKPGAVFGDWWPNDLGFAFEQATPQPGAPPEAQPTPVAPAPRPASIPPALRSSIERLIRARGMEPTDELVAATARRMGVIQ